MNSFAIVCLLAACVAQVIQAGPLDNMKFQLDQAKSNVDTIVRDLSRTGSQLQMNTRSRISNNKFENLRNANDYSDSVQKSIRTDVDAAKAEGKDAESCFTTAEATLRTVKQTAFSSSNNCEQTANDVLRAAIGKLEAAESTGESYKAELDRIFPSCFSGNSIQMQSCIAIKLGTTNQAIRSWQNTVSSLKNTANTEANNAFLSIMRCGFDVTSASRVSTTDVRIAANACIRNA